MYYTQRIKDLREDQNLTQKQIAKQINIDQRTYSRYELGINKMPIDHLIKICKFYNVSPEYILGFTNTKKPLPKE